MNKVKLRDQIKSDPYLKISNCTDKADLDYAVNRVRELREQHPGSKLLERMLFKIEYKRMKL